MDSVIALKLSLLIGKSSFSAACTYNVQKCCQKGTSINVALGKVHPCADYHN